jgi:hypothetical protein
MTEQEPARVPRGPGVRPALLTSLGVFGFLLAQSLVNRLIRTAQTLAYSSEFTDSNLERIWVEELPLAIGAPLFFAVGVFVCVWQLGPIVGDLRLPQVVTRAVLAAAVGAASAWVPRFFAGLIFVATTPELRAEPGLLGGVAFDAMMDSLGTFAALLPLVALAAVLLREWLRRHPPKQPPAGTLDEG